MGCDGCHSNFRVAHIMAHLQRRTCHIVFTFQFFSTCLLWYVQGPQCAAYIQVRFWLQFSVRGPGLLSSSPKRACLMFPTQFHQEADQGSSLVYTSPCLLLGPGALGTEVRTAGSGCGVRAKHHCRAALT